MKQPSKAKKVLKITILSLFIVLVAGIFVVGGMFFYLYNTTHLDINAISQNNLGVSIYDNNGKMLSQSVNSSKRLVDVNELPQYVLDAFTSIEDKNFYTHNGIEPYRIAKAMLVNIINKDKVQGASTITQQLIKNTLLSAEKTYSRKAKEIVLALKLENNMSKDQIMQEYLNTIYFGENCYGIENASEHYFGVRAKNLTLSQAATLAGMINAPSIYSPTNAKDKTMSRRNLVLKTMLALNKITQDEYNEAISQALVVIDNPHNFVNSYTRASIIETCDILDLTEKEFIRGQYKIYTYIDPEIQTSLESNLSKYDDVLAQQMVIDNENYSIIAYCGTGAWPLFYAKRQPASLVKPTLVYLPCFEENLLSPATPILDEELNIDGYAPQNYNKQFVGWTNVRNSLQKSLNIPSVKALSYLTLDKAKTYADKMGIKLDSEDMNMSLALGSIKNGVTISQITAPYTMLANGGDFSTLSMIKRIEDKTGKIVYERKTSTQKVASEDSAYLITDILKPNANSPTTSTLSSLGIDIASKTGTASIDGHLTDLWNVAYTPQYTITSWLGTENSSADFAEGYNSSTKATILTKQLIENTKKLKTTEKFTQPQSVVSIEISVSQYIDNHRLIQAADDEKSITEIFRASNLPDLPEPEPKIDPIEIVEQKAKTKKKRWWFI